MATPEPLRRYLQVQVAAEKEVIAILNQALSDIEGHLKSLEGKQGIGAAVRRTQISAARSATLRRLVEAWAKVGNVIETQAASAMLAAAQTAAKYDKEFLQRLGLSPAQQRAFQEGLEETSQKAVQLAVNRRFDTTGTTKRTLSERVYQSQALVSRQVEAKIESALARGLSARELSAEIRQFINPDVPGGASYSARRLARTEINNAFHYQQVQNAKGKPWVNGMKWNLSGSHPKVDTCDSLARGGKGGDGVYATGSVPGKPHPQCLCYLTPETVSPAEFEKRLLAGDYSNWTSQNLPK